MNRHHLHNPRRAFTLVEMLVVMGLIILAIGIIVPGLGQLQSYHKGSAAVTSISVATNAARIYNHRLEHSDMAGAGFPFGSTADYSGTAALFTPAGEIRLVINDQAAFDENNNPVEDSSFNAYEDINAIEYVRLPRSARVVGVQRIANTGTPANDFKLLPPPFAVRFNEFGHVATDQDVIYYDGDYDGVYDTDVDRDAPHATLISDPPFSDYHPANWDPRVSALSTDPDEGLYPLPFEAIEVVNAVIVFDAQDFYTEGDHDYDDVGWFFENGTAINFSPLSGLAITNE